MQRKKLRGEKGGCWYLLEPHISTLLAASSMQGVHKVDAVIITIMWARTLSLTDQLTDWLANRQLTDCLTDWKAGWWIRKTGDQRNVEWVNNWLKDCVVQWFIVWLVSWSVGWLIDRLEPYLGFKLPHPLHRTQRTTRNIGTIYLTYLFANSVKGRNQTIDPIFYWVNHVDSLALKFKNQNKGWEHL